MGTNMRVIAGSARSLKLVTPVGTDTRPTTDRIKETLFNMIQAQIPDSVVIDLFAGSGALGIEALSRGAAHAYFVENNTAAHQCIRENLRFTALTDKATVLRQDVTAALTMIQESQVDLIFIDPPYQKGYEEKILGQLSKMDYVNSDTLIVLEAARQFPAVTDCLPPELIVVREKVYKTNRHLFIKRVNEPPH